jgi:hypothetical protein
VGIIILLENVLVYVVHLYRIRILVSHGGEYEDGCLQGDRPDDGGSKDL